MIKAVPPRPPREPPVERVNPVHSHPISHPASHPVTPIDPWQLSPEQKKYYTNEFSKLQKDASGFLVPGECAREFFMKSKLPIEELILIWELADRDGDGKLTKFEFCLAFHLTLARIKKFPLPTQVPESLYVGLAGNF